MTTTSITEMLASYENGNCRVSIFADGTKVREWDGDSQPELPESLDLKITDWCDGGCAYCHERSTVRGTHADLETIQGILAALPAGVEIATGGGDTLSYPYVVEFLEWARQRGLIVNLTVNAMHLDRHAHIVRLLRDRRLIYGLGVSYRNGYERQLLDCADDMTVAHVIAGVDSVGTIRRLLGGKVKLLVLGYKHFGRGLKYFNEEVEAKLAEWRYWVGSLMRQGFVSFDNLAIDQLGIQDLVTPETWDAYYLGADGAHTMYVDAVRKEYARSSIGPRKPVGGMGINEMFANVKQTKKDKL